MWANWYMCQWDSYVESSNLAQSHFLIRGLPILSFVLFKDRDPQSYMQFREITQVLDAMLLDIETLGYPKRPMVAALLYLVIGKKLGVFSNRSITEELANSSLFLLDHSRGFNHLFSDFLHRSFNMQLGDLLPSIQYAASFFNLKISIELPTAAKINRENVLEVLLLLVF